MKAAILAIREIAEDMPYLMARASNEGRECGQILARETRDALEAAIAALEADEHRMRGEIERLRTGLINAEADAAAARERIRAARALEGKHEA